MFFQEASTFSTDEEVFEEALQTQDDQLPDLEVQEDSQTSTDSNSEFDPLEIADTSDSSDTSSSSISSSLYFHLLPDIIDDVNEELVDEFWPPNVVDEQNL